ncbi:uncharacterized protein BDR25DRAFT_220903 [Lindgomyces ingoldianus]|uniref:Uncharacterized protein n=1 Tax=Lindgomyces ingoldianus TaxID=673940 RepID=A0ACB6R127_9PLEO|nr:uncharacterized protein BDR25DRAFT_220903 [Lindgomyces ingoldianus]KAF2472538.1 hypothetical protein BDR25DRAFT_220903 [Lindgomyces ingoldianus]
MHELRWSLGDFLESYLDEPLPKRTLEPSRRRTIFKKALKKHNLLATIGVDQGVQDDFDSNSIYQEFDVLLKEPLFGQYQPDAKLEDVDFSGTGTTLAEKAPAWSKFISSMLSNERAAWRSYPKAKTSHNSEAYLITAVILRARARRRSNHFARLLGLYLHGSGTKRRVIETLSGLGLCDSYKVINKEVDNIADKTKSLLPRLAMDPQSTIVYDNYNFQDRIRDHALGTGTFTQRT